MFDDIENKVTKELEKWNSQVQSKEDTWNPNITVNGKEKRLIDFLQNEQKTTGEYKKAEGIGGIMINIEGIDNSGKTTCINHIKGKFSNPVLTTEPMQDESIGVETWIGQQVRHAISSSDTSPEIVLYLFLADHTNHLKQTVFPELRNGSTIICDRYTLSRYAYQTYALEGVVDNPLQFLREVQETGYWSVMPTKTIYLDVPASVSMDRMEGDRERYEKESFLEEIRQNYKKLSQLYDDQFIDIDATQPKEEMLQEVEKTIEKEI